MSEIRTVLAIARADFLERVRRYSFLFTLGFALYLGYLATAGNLVLQVGNMRGIFNSAWVGALLALVATDFISLAGFYFVKNTIERDRETRVGQILAATPISKFMYAFGKMVSNLAVLSLMLAVLAAAGIAMQLVSGEDRHIELWKLIAPFVLLAFPAMAVVAAIAVFFETVPFLRGGFGNVAYFFLVDRRAEHSIGDGQARFRPRRNLHGCRQRASGGSFVAKMAASLFRWLSARSPNRFQIFAGMAWHGLRT